MQHEFDTVFKDRGEQVVILWASEASIYGRFGFAPAADRARLSAATTSMKFLPSVDSNHGSVDEVTKDVFLSAAGPIHRKLLADRPGGLDRSTNWWNWATFDPEPWRDGAASYRRILHYDEAAATCPTSTCS